MSIEKFKSKKNHSIDYMASLLDGIAKMKENKTKFLVLLRNDKPYAIFTDRNLLDYLYKQTKLNIRLDLVADRIFQKVLTTDSMDHLANIFLSLEIRFVVIVDEFDNYKGIINRSSLLKCYKAEDKMFSEYKDNLPLSNINPVQIPCSFKDVVNSFYKEKQKAILLEDKNNLRSVITKNNIYCYIDSLDTDGNIVVLEKTSLELMDIKTNVKDVFQRAHEEEFEHIVLEDKEANSFYLTSINDIVHSCKTRYERLLEIKFQANNEFHNTLDVAMIEVYKLGDKFIASWLNSYAKKFFHIKPNTPINNLFPKEIWDKILKLPKSKKSSKDFYYPVNGIPKKINASCFKFDGKIVIKLVIELDNRDRKNSNKVKSVDFFKKKSLYNYIFYQNFMGIAYCHLDGTFIDINPFMENFLGYSKEELVGKNYFNDILHKEQSKSAKKLQKEFAKNKAFSTVVTRKFERKDGLSVWGLLLLSTIINEHNNEKYVLVFVQDYTNYYETYKNLVQQKEILSTIFDTVEDFIFFKDASLKYISCNDSMLNFMNLNREDVIGKSDHEIFSKTKADKFIKNDNIVKESRKKLVVRQKIENQDETKMMIGETTLKPRYDKNGKFYGIVGAVHNLTSRIENEDRRRIIQGIFDNTDEGIVVTDSKNEIVMVNPAFTKTTGYTMDDVRGKDPSVLSSQVSDQDFYHEMWESINRHGGWRGEIWNKRKSGEIYPELLTISLLRDEEGKIANHVGIFSDISEIKEKQERLEFLAHNDPLTNLANRPRMEMILKSLIRKSVTKNSKIAVLVFDIDNFKEINDTYGHSSGDRLLVQVAKRLQKVVKDRDFLARVGGDEFVIIVDGFYEKSYVENMIKKIANIFNLPFIVEDKMFNVTCTFGVSLYPKDGMDMGSLLKNADAAMYQAKRNKRNSYMFYTSDITDSLLKKMETLSDFRRAIKNDEFTLYYQPQFKLSTGEIIGVEALARWEHPVKGLIFPDGFIDLAEESQLIIPLGRALLRKVCEDIKRWLSLGINLENFRVAINISAVQILHDDIYTLLRDTVNEVGIDSKYIEVELTETSIMQDPDGAITLFNKIKKLGATIAIDDFGTGYSSLAYLKKFPADKIKIDRSFITDIPKDNDDIAITKAVLALSKNLKISAVAEGIEESAQRDFLIDEECENGQGYFYSKPLHIKDLEERYLQALI